LEYTSGTVSVVSAVKALSRKIKLGVKAQLLRKVLKNTQVYGESKHGAVENIGELGGA